MHRPGLGHHDGPGLATHAGVSARLDSFQMLQLTGLKRVGSFDGCLSVRPDREVRNGSQPEPTLASARGSRRSLLRNLMVNVETVPVKPPLHSLRRSMIGNRPSSCAVQNFRYKIMSS